MLQSTMDGKLPENLRTNFKTTTAFCMITEDCWHTRHKSPVQFHLSVQGENLPLQQILPKFINTHCLPSLFSSACLTSKLHGLSVKPRTRPGLPFYSFSGLQTTRLCTMPRYIYVRHLTKTIYYYYYYLHIEKLC